MNRNTSKLTPLSGRWSKVSRQPPEGRQPSFEGAPGAACHRSTYDKHGRISKESFIQVLGSLLVEIEQHHTRSAHYGLAPRSTVSSNKDSSESKQESKATTGKDSKSTACSGCGGIYHSSPTGAISPKARKVQKYHLTIMRLPHTWLQQRKLLSITLCTVNASLLPIAAWWRCYLTLDSHPLISLGKNSGLDRSRGAEAAHRLLPIYGGAPPVNSCRPGRHWCPYYS